MLRQGDRAREASVSVQIEPILCYRKALTLNPGYHATQYGEFGDQVETDGERILVGAHQEARLVRCGWAKAATSGGVSGWATRALSSSCAMRGPPLRRVQQLVQKTGCPEAVIWSAMVRLLPRPRGP